MKILFVGLPSILALVLLIVGLRSFFYVRFYFKKNSYSKDYSPKVAIFVPCKGLDPELEKNLIAVADQDYPDFTVTYIIESHTDPAEKVIKEVVSHYPHTTFVVSGLAHNCGQKNHNLLQAIARDEGRSEVYVFCDADVKPMRGWLRELIRPLAEEDTPVATGFQWIVPARDRLGEMFHTMMNGFISTLMANRNFKGIWGGSTAIRRETFESLGVGEQWKHTVVDDISLIQLLVRNKVARVYVPSCLTMNYQAISSVKGSVAWFIRQAMYVKYYVKPFWLLPVVFFALTSLVILSTPVLLVGGVFSGPLLWGGLSGLIFTVFIMFDSLLVKSVGQDNQKRYTWFFFSPLIVLIATYCLWKTVFLKTLIWRDTVYHLDKDGRVLSVVRNEIT